MNLRKIISIIILTLMTLAVGFLGVIISFGLQNSIADGTLIWQQMAAGIAIYVVIVLAVMALVTVIQLVLKKADAAVIQTRIHRLQQLLLTMSVVLLGVLPLVYRAANMGEAPGVMIISLGVILLPATMAELIRVVMEATEK